MRVLVVQGRPSDRNALTSILANAGHEVVCAQDATSALQLSEARPVQAAIIEYVLPGAMNGHELVRRIRAREGVLRTWIVMTNGLGTPGCIGTAMSAGADDFLSNRTKDEVLTRIDGMRRIGSWAKTAFNRDQRSRPDALHAWSAATDSFTATFGDMLGCAVDVGPEATPPTGDEIASLPLTLAADGYVVHVRVAFAIPGGDVVCAKLLGQDDPSRADRADVLREITNVLAGVWKRLATNEGSVFSLGIPADATTWTHESCLARQGWVIRGGAGPLVHVALELTQRSNELLAIPALREGMVLVHDLYNVAGAMLLRAGTRLSRTHLSHLERALGCKVLIEVALAA